LKFGQCLDSLLSLQAHKLIRFALLMQLFSIGHPRSLIQISQATLSSFQAMESALKNFGTTQNILAECLSETQRTAERVRPVFDGNLYALNSKIGTSNETVDHLLCSGVYVSGLVSTGRHRPLVSPLALLRWTGDEKGNLESLNTMQSKPDKHWQTVRTAFQPKKFIQYPPNISRFDFRTVACLAVHLRMEGASMRSASRPRPCVSLRRRALPDGRCCLPMV